MKRYSLIVLLTLCSVLLFAQSKSETQVAAATEQLRKAMVDGDKTALENLATEQLNYGHIGRHY